MLKKYFLCLLIIAFPAFSQKTLTIYTYSSFTSEWGAGPEIKEIFETDCQCTLNLISLESSALLLNRLILEGEKSHADIVIGLDNNFMEIAANTGLFAPHDIDTSSFDLPTPWKNPYFLPFDYGYFAFIYNSEKLKNPPQSLHELIESSAHQKIIYQDPRTSLTGLGLLLWIQKVYGEGAVENGAKNVATAWKKLAGKTLTVTKDWGESYGMFLKGEADMVFSYTSSPAYHINDNQDHRYKAALFSEGHYLNIELAALLASSNQPELAKQFLQFLVEKRSQQILAIKNWMYPVIDSAQPEVIKNLPRPSVALELTPKDVAEHRTTWINTWRQAVSR